MTTISSKTKKILTTVGLVVLVGATVVWMWSIVSHGRGGVIPPTVSTPNLAARSPAKKRRRRRRSRKNSKLSAVGKSDSSRSSSDCSTGSSTADSSATSTVGGTENSGLSNYSFASTYRPPSSNTSEGDVSTAVAAPSTTTQTVVSKAGDVQSSQQA